MTFSLRALGKVARMFTWHIPGRCPVCGKLTIFLCVDAVRNARNHLVCIRCFSYARKRHVAKVLTELCGAGGSLTSIGRTDITVFNAEAGGVFSSVLGNYPGYYSSEFLPGRPLGTELAPRVTVQDLEQLTFPDEMFDVVVTEDVFEHIRNDLKAFAEIHRVLKPGGVHLFTVPFFFHRGTLERIHVSEEDGDIYLLPPEFHGDPIRGEIVAYRTYGLDLYARLERLGFTTTVSFSSYADYRNGIVDSFVFISRKHEVTERERG